MLYFFKDRQLTKTHDSVLVLDKETQLDDIYDVEEIVGSVRFVEIHVFSI